MERFFYMCTDHKDSITIRISKEGETSLDFFPVSYSEFVIDYVYSREERERAKSMNIRKIYCG